jgi:hypothetical protein
MLVHIPPSILGAAENEAQNKKRNPESQTPTRTAMVALTVFDIVDATDLGSMLLNDLKGATLIAKTPSAWGGKPASLLRIKVKSTLAGTSSRLVNLPEIELRVWLSPEGFPLAAARDSNYSASFLFIKAANVRKEQWQIAVADDRLYASHAEQSNKATAIGTNIASSLSVVYVPK